MEVRRLYALWCGALVALSLLCAPTALAANPYVNFTKCPTGAPEMNDPSIDGAACASVLIREGSLKVGNIQASLASPMHVQFGFGIKESEPEPWAVVPGGTTLDAESLLMPNPFVPPVSAPPAAVPAPQKAKKKKKRCAKKRTNGKRKQARKGKSGKGRKGKKGTKRRCGKKRKHVRRRAPQAPPAVPAPPAPTGPHLIKATLEPAGDVRKLNPGALFGEPVPLLELPLKIHLEGTGLGPDCYVGTNAEPIVLAPLQVAPPTDSSFTQDPNGFKVEIISLSGGALEDATFAATAASGCGAQGILDGQVNALLGLPAPAGASKAVMGNVLFELAGAPGDEVPPEPGEELEAAFKAAGEG